MLFTWCEPFNQCFIKTKIHLLVRHRKQNCFTNKEMRYCIAKMHLYIKKKTCLCFQYVIIIWSSESKTNTLVIKHIIAHTNYKVKKHNHCYNFPSIHIFCHHLKFWILNDNNPLITFAFLYNRNTHLINKSMDEGDLKVLFVKQKIRMVRYSHTGLKFYFACKWCK